MLIILAGIFYGILNLAERSKDSIRLGLQDYLAKAFGQNAIITDMTTVELSPDMVFRMNGVLLHDKDDSKKTLVSIEKAYIGMPFIHMLTGRRNYIGLEIQNAKIASGYMFPQKMEISFAGISDIAPGQKPAVFLLEGRYNSKDILATLDLVRKNDKNRYLYAMPSTSGMTFKIGSIEATGVVKQSFVSLDVSQINMSVAGKSASFDMKDIQKNPVAGTLSGNIEGHVVDGLLTKTGENIVLAISAKTSDSKELDDIHAFIESFKKELGIEGNNTRFQIKLTNDIQKKN